MIYSIILLFLYFPSVGIRKFHVRMLLLLLKSIWNKEMHIPLVYRLTRLVLVAHLHLDCYYLKEASATKRDAGGFYNRRPRKSLSNIQCPSVSSWAADRKQMQFFIQIGFMSNHPCLYFYIYLIRIPYKSRSLKYRNWNQFKNRINCIFISDVTPLQLQDLRSDNDKLHNV